MLVQHFLFFVWLNFALGDIHKPIDLTHFFDKDSKYWPGSTPFHFTKIGEKVSPEGFWVAANDFQAGEHGGTHMDAPYHFSRDSWKIGDIPFERLFGKAVVINAAEEAAENPDYTLSLDKLIDWEERNGPMPEGSIIIVNYGWAEKYDNLTDYFGGIPDSDSLDLHFPGLSVEAAEWIALSGRVYGVGSDTPSIDPGQSNDFQAHQILGRKNIYILENIALNGTELPEKGFDIFALPMKIRHGTGAPCRIIAVPRLIALKI